MQTLSGACWPSLGCDGRQSSVYGYRNIGHDAVRNRYFTQFFDNGGHRVDYDGNVNGGVWTFAEPGTRSAVAFSEDGSRMT